MFRLEREAIDRFSFAGQYAKIGRKRKNEELRMKKISTLFGTFLKIGAFTFGGGYAMVALLEHEFVEEKQWMSR